MTRIRVNTEDLKNKAKDFDSAADAFNRAGDEIAAAAMSMPSYDGQLSGPARKAGYEIQSQAREMKTALSANAESLRKTAQAFEDVENQTIETISTNIADLSAWDSQSLIPHETAEPPPVSIDLGPIVLEFFSIPWSQTTPEPDPYLNTLGKVLEVLGAFLDLSEAITAAATMVGAPDFLAAVDFIVSIFYSWFEGESYYGKVSDEYPPMLVLGQDVWVTGAELILPFLAKAIGAASTGGPGVIPGGISDVITSVISAGYDVGRLSDEIPTIMTMGIYFTDDGKMHVVFISNSEV